MSTAFFSDRNTFATPTDPSYTKVVSFNKKRADLPPDPAIEFALSNCNQGIDGACLLYICFQFSPLGSFMVSGVSALRFRRDSKQRRVTTKAPGEETVFY